MTTLTSTGAVNLTSSTNWSPAQTPVAGDDLIIQGHTLTLDADMTLNSVTINNANSRLAISGTTRSVQATNGWIVAAQPGSTLISGALAAGTSVTLTGTWSGGAGLVNAIATSTGGNLTLQTVGASQSEVLFADVVGNIARSITSSWSGGSLTTIGRFSLGSWTAAISIVTMTGGTWSHQSSGTNSFGAGGHRLANVSGTATVNWTGSIDSQSNISNSGLFFLGSSSGSHTIGQSGDVFLLRNATTSAGGLTTIIYLQFGVVELVGQFTQRGDAQLIYSFSSGTMRWRNQSQSIPSPDTCIIHAVAGTIDLSGLVLTNAGKFVLLEYGSGATTVTAGTSITCTSITASACAWGTTVLDDKIVVLESSPATLPTNAQVAAGVSYGYSGAPQTGTGLIMDPATLATAMLTSFGSLPEVMTKTTIATLASQTSFTLTAGSADDDVYNGLSAVITDQSTSVQKAVATVSDYTGSTKTVTLSAAPGFTIATGDLITIIAGASGGGGGASFPSEAPPNWLKAAGIQDGAFTASKFAASSLNDKGNWSKAGDAMALTSGERTTFATVLEAAMFNEADATALLAAIANKVETFLINDGDAVATLAAIAAAVNAAIVAGQIGTDLTTTKASAATAATQSTNAATSAATAATQATAAASSAAAAKTAAESADSKLTAPRLAKIDGAAQTGADGDTLKTVSDQIDGIGGGGGGSGDAEQATLLEVQETVTAISAALAGAPVEPTGRIASGGGIVAYIGDDFRVRSGTQLQIPVSDPSGGLYTKLNTIGAANLAFGASRPDKAAGAISGTIASLATSGSGASQLLLITVEISNCGSGLRPGDDYTYQIEDRQTQGAEVDSFVRIEGSLDLRKKVI